MQHALEQGRTRVGRTLLAILGLCVPLTVFVLPSLAQVSPEEHAKHHPGQAQQPASGPAGMAPPAGVGPPGGMEGMGDMAKMMEGMGKPPPKELYPSLMALPELTPEQRKEVDEQAGERMHAGATLMAKALDTLNAGTQSGDYAAMHEAMAGLREGAAQFESGITARRALAEGRAPRAVALDWFKREMNLTSPVPQDEPRAVLGVGAFHLFTMGLLIAFGLAMVAMYFFKMRRAAALFGRIDPDSGKPPPGSAPPLVSSPLPAGANTAPPEVTRP